VQHNRRGAVHKLDLSQSQFNVSASTASDIAFILDQISSEWIGFSFDDDILIN